jgi:hypothetical protein
VPESVTFRVTTYFKLAKGETGLTQLASQRVGARIALDWILSELGDGVTIHNTPGKTLIAIEWSEVPEEVRNPKIPARRSR